MILNFGCDCARRRTHAAARMNLPRSLFAVRIRTPPLCAMRVPMHVTEAAPTQLAATAAAGLVCTNPPYGVRLEDREAARGIHRELGKILRERFCGWQAAVLTDPQCGLELGIRAYRTHVIWNGALEMIPRTNDENR